MNWADHLRLSDGRRYAFGSNPIPTGKIKDIGVCVVLIESFGYGIVAAEYDDEPHFSCIGPFDSEEAAAITMRLMS